MTHPRADMPAMRQDLINITELKAAYYKNQPDLTNSSHRVSFSTSGHRGNPILTSFNKSHVLVIVQTVCKYRSANEIYGLLFVGMDTHAMSECVQISTLEVSAANLN
ncbi:hypothetical protein [Pelagibaculum spongiae]|uniref:Alpha-D-phosphohexomutase alpha/beta/alpha domain-containing protein n=1 Tax=Pelagibaculum spongiae TaxID=2080658 RepID=A0A2V1GW32_9GAMM|nr:hypothetical protein [Pelagibaculum spongiae]PVZ70230.1 hypothetical protein DC094_06415 [Pelagibaculum spongiae]